jgi:hypothetical protein
MSNFNTLKAEIPVFRGDKYNQWATAMKNHLQSMTLWNLVNKKEDEPVADTDATKNADLAKRKADWNDKNQKAIGTIRLRCSDSIQSWIDSKNIDKAFEVWDALKGEYEQLSIATGYEHFVKAMSVHLSPHKDPTPEIYTMLDHFARLEAVDATLKVPVQIQAMMLMYKIPKQWEAAASYLINTTKNISGFSVTNILQALQ